MTKQLSLWLPVFLWAGLIFFFSSLPIIQDDSFRLDDFLLKKSAHVLEYLIFYLLLIRALKMNNSLLSPPKLGGEVRSNRTEGVFTIHQKAFLIGLFYAFTDETHQFFTPGRGAHLRDVLVFDSLGLLLAWIISKKRSAR